MNDGTIAEPSERPFPRETLVESTPRQILMRHKEFKAAFEYVEQTLRKADIKESQSQGEIRIKLGAVLPIWIPKAILHLYRRQNWAVFLQDSNPHELVFNFY